LNTADTLCDVNVLLQGYNSNLSADIAYLLGESKKLDLNLLASHKGKKSSSEINVRGVLKKGSEKVFKGTIDFLSGSEGAVGAEQEDVLLMDEGVVNKTVPLILCAEEDVSGSHGASIGRVDEKQVFYMRSRGLSEEKIYDLMAQAKLRQVIDMIDDEDAKRRISTILTGGAEVVT
ncbi:MAG: SufD family Fe-S cluster assembly protein, partial [Ruminococcus sp.]|nr:SufD family Fe-S cluster assembly protein [Ruminococcus sp.]